MVATRGRTTAASDKATIDDEIAKARSLAVPLSSGDRVDFARTMTFNAAVTYWSELEASSNGLHGHSHRPLARDVRLLDIPPEGIDVAHSVGRKAAELDLPDASYIIGALYTGTMPKKRRAELGAYYTPPALSDRLLDMATEAGVDWGTAQVLDPACGGGAFLSPVARRMVASMEGADPSTALTSVERRLYGIELDPFAAWLSQVFLDVTLASLWLVVGRRPQISIQVQDALETQPKGPGFDLVVGNPPYGRIGLPDEMRSKFERSLHGHANLYGLFTDLALRFARVGGAVAYVTPTSFLSGAYFKALRRLLGQEAPPSRLDFLSKRKGIFVDVLQETTLAVYQRGAEPGPSEVRVTSVMPDGTTKTSKPCWFRLPEDPEHPWLIPRSHEQAALVRRVNDLPHRLSDYGYEVSTGPLVWNRHKTELRATPGPGRLPLIWAESVRPDGIFEFRAEQRTHQPYFQPKGNQGWLVTRAPCVLLQRTTAKEQVRRLIAAELPPEFDAEHGGVVIENHLNIIRPLNGQPKASTRVLTALFNSAMVDQVFRCINGSVAVSAYELEALPLPSPKSTNRLEELLERGADRQTLDKEVERLYGHASE